MPTVRELEALVAERRRLLGEAEDALAQAKARAPEVGDFVRSTLTNFYGQVTKVIPRASGRPWVEMTPYLAPNLPGSSTLDLYDTWEIIDAPATGSVPEQEPTSLEIVRNLTEVIVSYEPWDRTSPTVGTLVDEMPPTRPLKGEAVRDAVDHGGRRIVSR